MALLVTVWLVVMLAASGSVVAATDAAPEPESGSTPIAAPASQAADPRLLLLQQQAGMQARFDSEIAACRKRFAVTGCVQEVERQRRAALAPLREALIRLDEAERHQRAAARRQSLAEKQVIRAQRLANLPSAQADTSAAVQSPSPASAPVRQRQRLLPAAAPVAPLLPLAEPTPALIAPERAADAAQRVRDSQRRQAESEQRRERVQKRLAEREQKNKASASLPAPEPAASSAKP